jgi:hypothetical protein
MNLFKRLGAFALMLAMAFSFAVPAAAENPYGIDDMKLYLIDEYLPVHDVVPSLLIIINTDGTPRETIDSYVEDYRARMLVCGEATVITDTLYYTSWPAVMQNNLGPDHRINWNNDATPLIQMINDEYPNEDTRPRWRRVLLYADDISFEGTAIGRGSGYKPAISADYYNNMRVIGIGSGQVGIHGSVHVNEIQATPANGFMAKYGNCHVMSQTELDAWAEVWDVPKINPDDARFKPGGEYDYYRETEGNAVGWSPSSNALFFFLNPELMTDERRTELSNTILEHHLWVKQKFITELNVDDYEAAWDFAQYPLPADETERAEVLTKLRMNEMTWEDCDRLYGAEALAATTTPPPETTPTTTTAIQTTPAPTTTAPPTTEPTTTEPTTTEPTTTEPTTTEPTTTEPPAGHPRRRKHNRFCCAFSGSFGGRSCCSRGGCFADQALEEINLSME